MIFKANFSTALSLLFAFLLGGCAGSDDNVNEAGLVLHVGETHYQQDEVVGDIEIAAGGYAQNALEHHTLRDQNGVQVSLYRTYLVIDNLALVPCASVAQWPQKFFDLLLPKVYAHAGHGSEPVGGRALDKPNVIDLITQDGFILPLGDTAIAPGRYCELQVSLTRLAGDAYGKPEFSAASTDDPVTSPEIPDMNGKIFAMRSDYCAQRDSGGVCVRRQQVNIDDAGLSEPMTQTIPLATPLVIDATLREAYSILGIEYDAWLANIDVALLGSDQNERQKLLDNISDSFRVYAAGLGDLPVNAVSD